METDERDAHLTTAPAPAPASESSAPYASPSRTVPRGRGPWVTALIGITTLLLVIGVFAVWANRLLFSPDNWSNTSTQLLQNPNIRATTANYLVDQLYANVDIGGLIRAGLPPQLQALAAPAAGALRNSAVQGVELALSRPRVQNLWAKANRVADQSFIAVVNGGKGPVGITQGVVTLNLGSLLDDVATRLGLPAGLAAKLPPNIANLTVFKSDQLKLIQNGGNAIRGLALWLTILVPVLYALAILLATGHRRRALMRIGFAGVLAGIVVLLGRSILESQITNSLTDDATLRPSIRATIAISTAILSDVATAVVFIAIVLIAAAWLAGPARLARIGREAIAPFLREHPGASLAITLGVMVLVFIWDPIHATGTPAGIIVFMLLALLGTEILIRQTAQEFPDARAGAASDALRGRMANLRLRRQQPATPPRAAGSTTAEQLGQLADLHDRGALTVDEYQAAKLKLLSL